MVLSPVRRHVPQPDALGSRHYPTRTVIDLVKVNGREVDLEGGPHAVVEGSRSGSRQSARARSRSRSGTTGDHPRRRRNDLPLERAESESESRCGVFNGELARLSDPVQFQVFVGDAWTDPIELLLVPLPVIEVSLDVTPPDYATGPEVPTGTHTGLRQIAVVEGSQVRVRIASTRGFATPRCRSKGKGFRWPARPGIPPSRPAKAGPWSRQDAPGGRDRAGPLRGAGDGRSRAATGAPHPGVIRIKPDHPRA